MLKMMIADDERIIREGLRDLVDWKQHNIQIIGEASNGKQALHLIEKLQPDILLTDIVMPGMSGIELIEAIRNNQWDLQVVFISAHQDQQYIRSAFRFEAIDYIMKPFSNEELIQSLEQVKARIKERKEQEQHVLRMKDQLAEAQDALLRKRLHDDHEREREHTHPDVNNQPSSDGSENREQKIVYEIKKVIQQRLQEDLTLAQLADQVFLSQSHMVYLFKKVTGETIVDYMTQLRMEKAKSLLQDYTLKIYQVADATGYRDANYFSRLFKRQFGYTPKEYRERLS